MSGVLRSVSSILPSFSPNFSVRWIKRIRTKIPLPKEIKFKSQEDALLSKGFLRSFKPYEPPTDAVEKVNEILSKHGIANDHNAIINDPSVRFSILNECFEVFDHSVPNSLLYMMNSVGDIREFYRTPVNTTTPYDEMKNKDLPKNLHIQYDYVRFHPDTDTKFGGISAYPKRSTIVTGLKYKKKYPGHVAKTSWP